MSLSEAQVERYSRQLILDAQASPACYCLFPCDRPVSHADLIAGVGTLN